MIGIKVAKSSTWSDKCAIYAIISALFNNGKCSLNKLRKNIVPSM